jgi:hypothetical protein
MNRWIACAAMLLGLCLPGQAAFAQELVFCAREGEFCRVPYPTQVIYGVRGRSTGIEVRRGVPCTNQAFGDPAPGVPKRCLYVARRGDGRPDPGWNRPEPGWGRPGPGPDRPREGWGRRPEWRTCAPENGFCRWQGTKRVRYGVSGRFVERSYRNGVACTNSVFGDPAPGRPKVCQVLD